MSMVVGVEERLRTYGLAVNERLQVLLPPQDQRPTELHSAMRYSCLAGGKRLRPALCIASAEAVGGSIGNALDAACAIEMVHCFSLIHDDLPAIDDDDLRRGVPTCHVQFGEAIAILAGDALFALAFQILSSLDAEPGRLVQATSLLARASGSNGLVGGEVVDVLSEGQIVDRETLEFIHSRKTGSLISASCEIGTILGGGSLHERDALRTYGDSVGLAFQIADDILNETSTAEQLGKAAGSDRERNKATYPALFGLDASRDMAIAAVERGIASLGGFADPTGLIELAHFSVHRLH
ncbi:MAG: polyprenyl synthetase family protein [Fimbriimonas sp.]